MADKVVLEAEVKSNIGDVKKDAKGLLTEFEFMGVSIDSIKASFAKIIPTAKAMFGTIKAGIASTGIGLLVIALGSVVAFFTKTKKGAEVLEVALAGIGAVINVIVDRVSKFGSAIVKLFQGDTKGALNDVKGVFKGIGEEIANDVKLMAELKRQTIALRDSERELNVETAQRRAEIEALKLLAEDVTKGEKERLDAAREAFRIENELLEKRVANAEKAVEIQQREMAHSENMAEDLDKLAELEINLANIKQESTTKQIELNNKINAIEKEAETRRKQAQEEELQRIKDINDEKERAAKEVLDAQIKAADDWYARVKELYDREIAIAQATENFKKATIEKGFGAAAAMAGENAALSKGVAMAQTVYQTQQGIMAALGATSVGDKLLPYPLRLANAIATGVMGATALAKIASTDPSGAGATSSIPTATATTPAPEVLSGAFSLDGAQEPEPARAYVVSDDITNNQDKLALIRRRATI